MDLRFLLVAIGLFYSCIAIPPQKFTRFIVPTVLVHGGAGDISDLTVTAKREGVKLAANVGYETLTNTGSALEAVIEAVRSMELDPTFNAGYGAVLTLEGKVEMDAAIMNGSDLSAGCVSLARDIYHPVMLARAIMERTPHRYLAGDGAMAFAEKEGFEILPEGALVTDEALKELADYKKKWGIYNEIPQCMDSNDTSDKDATTKNNNTSNYGATCDNDNADYNSYATSTGYVNSNKDFTVDNDATSNKSQKSKEEIGPQKVQKKKSNTNYQFRSGSTNSLDSTNSISKVNYGKSPGTVGAVAIDKFGNIAAATSTGGITGKMPGRIGDSPILGAGTYADNASGGVSATGHGETFMRYNVASRILALIQLRGLSAQEATLRVLESMTARFNQTGGIISIDLNGGVGICFTSRRMAWAYRRGYELHHGLEKGEDIVEIKGTDVEVDFY